MALSKTEWFKENRVIYQQYSGKVTFKDLQAGKRAIAKLLGNSAYIDQKLHVIVDLSERQSIAPEVMNMNSMREIFSPYSEFDLNMGWFLVVQSKPHPVMRFIALAAAKLTGFNLRVFSNIETAYTFLKRADTSLPDSFQSV